MSAAGFALHVAGRTGWGEPLTLITIFWSVSQLLASWTTTPIDTYALDR